MKRQQERRPCEAPAGKEGHVMRQQGKKTLWNQREEKPHRACFLSMFSSGGHFFQPIGTILAILVKRHKRNIPVE